MRSSSPTPRSSPTTARHTGIVSYAVLQEFAVDSRLFHVQDAEALWLLMLEVAISRNYVVIYHDEMLPASIAKNLSEKQRREECSLPLRTIGVLYIRLIHLLQEGPVDVYDLFMDWQKVNFIE